MVDIKNFLERAAARTGFKREFYIEKNYPTLTSSIVVIPFFGDMNSTFILSSFLLKRYKELNPSKYIILCSWPGAQALFPYVDEYWTLDSDGSARNLAVGAQHFANSSDLGSKLGRTLFEVFSNVMTYRDLWPYYKNGFKDKFWKELAEDQSVWRYLPQVTAANRIREDFKNQLQRRVGPKVVIYPVSRMRTWQQGREVYVQVPQVIWGALINKLLDQGFVPVVYQNYFTYDMSRDFVEKCIYLASDNLSEVMCAMSYLGCVLDLFSGISRIAIAARTPFVAIDERARYTFSNDCAVDDLCCGDLPHKYVFSFSTLFLTAGPAEWDVSVMGNVVTALKDLLPLVDQRTALSHSELHQAMSYDKLVKQRQARKLGVNFINVAKSRK